MGVLFSGCLGNSESKIEDEYELGAELGKGAYGVVYKAKQIKDGNFYAVKRIQRKDLKPDDEEDIQREVEILGKLKHKYVLTLIDYFKTPEVHDIVTEMLEGGELFDRISAKHFYTEKEAKEVMHICFSALRHIHENNIVHRDLKPENLLLLSKSDDMHLKIADFGLAGQIKGSNGMLVGIAGTPYYMAPEMVSKKPYSYPADVWSMGVICFILLGGYPPFQGDNMGKLLTRIKKADYAFDPKYWGGISADAKDLIAAMLTLDPSKRITIKNAMEHKWIRTSDEALAAKSLAINHAEFRKYNARRKLKAAVDVVMVMNTFQHKDHVAHIDEHHETQK